jgi:hypothetical protein
MYGSAPTKSTSVPGSTMGLTSAYQHGMFASIGEQTEVTNDLARVAI